MIGNANDEINFTQKLLLTNRQVSKLPKAFANNRLPLKNYQILSYLKQYN